LKTYFFNHDLIYYKYGAMTTRTQYLLFISIWVAAIAVGVILIEAFGLSFGDDVRSIRATSFIIGTLALLPAAAGFALIRGCGSVITSGVF
jgi:hypothetical protein